MWLALVFPQSGDSPPYGCGSYSVHASIPPRPSLVALTLRAADWRGKPARYLWWRWKRFHIVHQESKPVGYLRSVRARVMWTTKGFSSHTPTLSMRRISMSQGATRETSRASTTAGVFSAAFTSVGYPLRLLNVPRCLMGWHRVISSARLCFYHQALPPVGRRCGCPASTRRS